jgi:hypothetical protein
MNRRTAKQVWMKQLRARTPRTHVKDCLGIEDRQFWLARISARKKNDRRTFSKAWCVVLLTMRMSELEVDRVNDCIRHGSNNLAKLLGGSTSYHFPHTLHIARTALKMYKKLGRVVKMM